MKRLLVLSIACIMMMGIGSCGQKYVKVRQGVVLQQKLTPTPAWVSDEGYRVVNEEGKKVIYVVVEAERPGMETARIVAESSATKDVADSIKKLATTEIAVARSEAGESGTMDEYVEETIAATAKNVTIIGLQKVGDYWEQIEMKSDKGVKEVYRYYLRYRLSYEAYKENMKLAWTKSIEKIVDPEKKKMATKITENLGTK